RSNCVLAKSVEKVRDVTTGVLVHDLNNLFVQKLIGWEVIEDVQVMEVIGEIVDLFFIGKPLALLISALFLNIFLGIPYEFAGIKLGDFGKELLRIPVLLSKLRIGVLGVFSRLMHSEGMFR